VKLAPAQKGDHSGAQNLSANVFAAEQEIEGQVLDCKN
jgi:hypothetical protein